MYAHLKPWIETEYRVIVFLFTSLINCNKISLVSIPPPTPNVYVHVSMSIGICNGHTLDIGTYNSLMTVNCSIIHISSSRMYRYQ